MDPCQAWTELFSGKNRGKIYDHFIRKRTSLIDHLKDCTRCTILIMLADDSWSQYPENFHFLNDIQFAELIRELYKKYHGNQATFAP